MVVFPLVPQAKTDPSLALRMITKPSECIARTLLGPRRIENLPLKRISQRLSWESIRGPMGERSSNVTCPAVTGLTISTVAWLSPHALAICRAISTALCSSIPWACALGRNNATITIPPKSTTLEIIPYFNKFFIFISRTYSAKGSNDPRYMRCFHCVILDSKPLLLGSNLSRIAKRSLKSPCIPLS